MSKPLGGRGIKAPYESTHMRVPLPLKEQFEAIIEDYRTSVMEDVNLLTGYDIHSNNPLTGLDDAKSEARKLIRAKKSASQSLAKLLSTIYQVEVTVEELK